MKIFNHMERSKAKFTKFQAILNLYIKKLTKKKKGLKLNCIKLLFCASIFFLMKYLIVFETLFKP